MTDARAVQAGMTSESFEALRTQVESRLLAHPVVTGNAYTAWFATGALTRDDLRAFTVQFSVFSNLFLLAALNRVINAATLESARDAKEILMNELGVIYASSGPARGALPRDLAEQDGDPDLVSTEGSVEGGRFRFRAAHFEWLVRFAQPLGLGPRDLGKRRHGTPATLFFCDELFRLYGSDDENEATGAAFAVENWAAAGFWRELIAGLEQVRAQHLPDLSLAFFTWHARIEEQHRAHVWDELRACADAPSFDAERFLRAGEQMLDAVQVFWDGLLADVRARAEADGRNPVGSTRLAS